MIHSFLEVHMIRYLFLSFFTLSFFPAYATDKVERQNSIPIPLHASRLVSDTEHTAFLKGVLATAKREVMISSYNVSPERLFGDDQLGRAIINAAKRGIGVYVYYENRPWYSEEDYEDLEEVASHCAKFEENANHSKCVIKDKEVVAIGSHNWLSDTREGSSNGTMVVTGNLAFGLIEDVWQGIRFYQSLEYGNGRGVRKFLNDKDAFSTGEYQFSPGQFLYSLRTPEAHGIFFNEMLQKAEARILIFSPFIRLQKLKETFTFILLKKLEERGIMIKLITLPSPCDRVQWEQEEIFTYLDSLCVKHKNFSYLKHANFHAKTLIVDNVICEGSFNWLSAVTQINHGANNCEISVALKGDNAQELIQSFEGTQMGKFVLAKLPEKPKPSLKKETSVVPKLQQNTLEAPKKTNSRNASDLDDQSSNSRKKQKPLPIPIPPSFDSKVKVFSGERFGIEGYCVRFKGGDYLNNNGDILYYATPEKAKEAAYKAWRK
jgi:hypothetical protein